MSPTPADTSTPPPAWPMLDMNERRVLGVLVEKSKTTPDAYPMSINALVTGCNQKSNRDPILELTEVDIEDALASAQKKGLTIKVTGGRVVRWRHAIYDAWKVDKVEAALLAELLLRGPQTEGELRGRASRMESIDDLDTLRAKLRPMAERGLVVYLTPQGRRGTVLTHGFHALDELAGLRARHAGAAVDEEPQAVPPAREPSAPGEIETLKQSVAVLQAELTTLKEELRQLRAALGM